LYLEPTNTSTNFGTEDCWQYLTCHQSTWICVYSVHLDFIEATVCDDDDNGDDDDSDDDDDDDNNNGDDDDDGNNDWWW